VVVGAAANGASLAMLQQAANEIDDSYGSQVIVTGTRRAGRTLSDSPVPVDVITGEQLR
jgi:iron complex outermembrane receptor protein